MNVGTFKTCGFSNKYSTPLTFLHTAMRMMIDMMMIATNARTAASTATWEKSAVT